MKKKLTLVLTTALCCTVLPTTAYGACNSSLAAKLSNNSCPSASCLLQNKTQENDSCQQTSGKNIDWNSILHKLMNQTQNRGENTLPSLNKGNCNQNSHTGCIKKDCTDKNGSNNSNTDKNNTNTGHKEHCNNRPNVNPPENNQDKEDKPNFPGIHWPEINLPEQNQPITPEQNQGNQGNQENTNNNNNEESNKNNNEDDNKNESTQNSYVEQVVSLVNAERAKEGLAPLQLDSKVSAAAQVRAQEIVSLFSHTRPDGTSCFTALDEADISYQSAGENIAYGQRTPEEVVTAWMNSAGHRANIMNPNFTSIGVGYYTVGNTAYWSQLFTH